MYVCMYHQHWQQKQQQQRERERERKKKIKNLCIKNKIKATHGPIKHGHTLNLIFNRDKLLLSQETF